MTTVLLTFLVLLINLFVYGSQSPQYYGVASHSYYGIMILAGIYDGHPGQRVLLTLTTLANCLYVLRYYNQPQLVVVATVVATLYPFIAYFIVRTIRQLQSQRLKTERQIGRINQANAELEKSVRDQSTLFEVSEAANANLDLDELFQRIIRILADRMGTYRGTLRLWRDGELVRCVEAVFGLTPAEIKRGTDAQIDEIQRKVLNSGQAIGVPHTRVPLEQINLLDVQSVQSKAQIAFWCIPLIVDEKVIGTLTIDKASEEFSTEDNLRILTIIASIIAQRVKIQQMIEALVQSERLVTLGKLATTIAHEVRNPLGGIRGCAQLLQMVEDNDSADIHEYTAVIIKEVDRLDRVIEQLLAFGKPQTTNFKPHAVDELIDDSLSICQPELDANHIRVERLHDDCPPAVLDADGMTQVLLNLFRNAIEAMDGGGVLTIHTQHDPANQTVQIRVQDTGRGISPAHASRLFDPFYTTKQKGTGLGLAISHRILEEHGGTIKVDVTQPQGTAFIITLPV